MKCNCGSCIGDHVLRILTHDHESPCTCKICVERRKKTEEIGKRDEPNAKVGSLIQLAIMDTVRPLLIAKMKALKPEELTTEAMGIVVDDFLDGLCKGVALEVSAIAKDSTHDITGEILFLQIFIDKMHTSQSYIMGNTALRMREYEAMLDARARAGSGMDVLATIVEKMGKTLAKKGADKPTAH